MNELLSSSDYKFVFANCVRLCVDLILETKNGILVGRRSHEPYKGIWALPGGRMVFKENIDDSIFRILRKEMGIEPVSTKLFDVLEFPEEVELSGTHSVALVYAVRYKGIPQKQMSAFDEVAESSNIKPSDILEKHRNVIKKYLGGKKYE